MLVRVIGWLHRLAVGVSALGVRNATKAMILGRLSNKPRTIVLPTDLRFTFRGKRDKGVVSHFYSENYYIEDASHARVRRILDCGANIGDETARFCVHYPEAEVVALEPETENFSLLKSNFAGRANVRVMPGAIWPADAELKLVPPEGGHAEAFRVEEGHDGGDSIQTWTIPGVMEEMGWEAIDILKLDIEGAEYELFTREFEVWIDKVNVIIVETPDNDRPGTSQAMFRAFGTLSVNCYVCGENLVLIRTGLDWKLKKVVGFIHGGSQMHTAV